MNEYRETVCRTWSKDLYFDRAGARVRDPDKKQNMANLYKLHRPMFSNFSKADPIV